MTRYHTYPTEHLATATQGEMAAWMARERADLLAQLAGLDERILCEQPVLGDWTAKDLLAHVAQWDAFFARSVAMALAGRADEVPDVNMDEANAAAHIAHRDWSLAKTLEASAAARADFLQEFWRAPAEALDTEWQFGWGRASLRRIAKWRGYHDSEHATQIEDWRAKS